MEKKKRSKSAVSRIKDSLVFIEPTEDTLSIDFKDKGLKIQVTSEYAIISTTFHKHIFDAITSNGYNEVYLFIKNFVEIALEQHCMDKNEEGVEYYSYYKLAEKMSKKDADREKQIIFQYCDMWLLNIYQPLHTLQSNSISSFVVYLNYVSNLANTSVLLKENKKDLTNVGYIKEYLETFKKITEGIEERVIIDKTDDEELVDNITEEKKEVK